MRHHFETLADADDVARTVATFVAEEACRAVDSRGSFHFAVSGGHTPWAVFAELATETVPWEAVVLYQVDERVAPPEDPDRSLHRLERALRSARARVKAMLVNDDDLDAAAARYADWLVTGEDNKEPLARLIAGDTTVPIGRVQAGASLVLADQTPEELAVPRCQSYRPAVAGSGSSTAKVVEP